MIRCFYHSTIGIKAFSYRSFSSPSNPFNILFFGSDEFSIKTLTPLLKKNKLYSNLEVVLPYNQNQPLKAFASQNNLKCHRAPHKTLKEWKPPIANDGSLFDLAVVVSFGYFIPKSVLSQFKRGCVNVHPSLLPKYRGASPIQYTILNQDTETGVSIIDLDPLRLDSGRILHQSRLSIPKFISYPTLHGLLSDQGGKDLVYTLENLEDLQNNAIVQDESKVSKAPKLKTEGSRVFWNEKTNVDIYAMYLAFGDKIPLHSTFQGKRIQILKMENPTIHFQNSIDYLPDDAAAGSLFYLRGNEYIYIKCKEGWVAATLLKVEGKSAREPLDFHNGYQFKNCVAKFE
ncbi:formyl transferase [Globomyces pollinis-pini]|nr:formyl transferase [Globomyces pollinis-pini]